MCPNVLLKCKVIIVCPGLSLQIKSKNNYFFLKRYKLTDLMISAHMAVELFRSKDGDFISVETVDSLSIKTSREKKTSPS